MRQKKQRVGIRAKQNPIRDRERTDLPSRNIAIRLQWALVLGAFLLICPDRAYSLQEDSPRASNPLSNPDTLTDEPSAEALAFYEDRIKPILVDNCAGCHADDPEAFEGGLGITGRASLLRGGHSGPAVDLKKPDKSLFLLAVEHELLQMPPDEKLPQENIDDIKKWIEMGLPWTPEDDIDHGPPEKHSLVDEKAKLWWAFQPVARPQVPTTQDDSWSKNETDHFIYAKLREADLSPAPPADRRTLIRRATYDLIGLPPTPEEIEAFVNDESPDAFEKRVEQLLASPQYGEKWGRHWLDLVRYAESNSFERDGTKPFVWRYRDYVIRAFNDDKPYNQFLLEQLAGDELDEVTIESVIATGYYRLGQWDDEPADPQQAKFDELDDILGTTSQTMLGLTINCARCHDHKIDPISQRDYYSMLSFLGNVRRYGIRSNETVFDASVRTMENDRNDPETLKSIEQVAKQISEVESNILEIENKAIAGFEPVEHEEFQYEMHKVRLIKKQVGNTIEQADMEQYERLKRQHGRLKQRLDSNKIQILAVKEHGTQLPQMKVRIRGNPHVEGVDVEPAFPEVFGLGPVSMAASQSSTGARRALADWIVSESNPLTARVMVNRIWQYHFGEGIVRTSSDFGYQGSLPTHPELLDWLAAEFVESNWSIKAIHRKVMLSAAYQMSGAYNQVAYDKDPLNERLWRFKLRRLTAEEIRDSALLAAGQLNVKDMFGPSIFPKMPKEILQGQSMPGDNWRESPKDQQNRRSVYVHVKRSMQLPILATHDTADTDAACPIRFVTTQPTQSLTMLNSEFTGDIAKEMASSLAATFPDDQDQQIREAFSRVTQRPPVEAETNQLKQILEEWKTNDGLNQEQAMQQLCLLLLNLNEFVYVD